MGKRKQVKDGDGDVGMDDVKPHANAKGSENESDEVQYTHHPLLIATISTTLVLNHGKTNYQF